MNQQTRRLVAERETRACVLFDFLDAIYDGKAGAPIDGEVVALAHGRGGGFPAAVPSRRVNFASLYSCVTTVRPPRPDPAGRMKLFRCIRDTVTLHAMVFDDIGTKGTEPPAAPTWIMETSAGNTQWGFKIAAAPVDATTHGHYDQVMAHAARRGWNDKGMRDIVRLFRVPGSVNEKPGRGLFAARPLHEDWSRTYTLQALALALGLALTDPTSQVAPQYPARAVGRLEGTVALEQVLLTGADGAHDALVRLAASLVARRYTAGAVQDHLRDLLTRGRAHYDPDRWAARFAEIEPAVTSAVEKFPHGISTDGAAVLAAAIAAGGVPRVWTYQRRVIANRPARIKHNRGRT